MLDRVLADRTGTRRKRIQREDQVKYAGRPAPGTRTLDGHLTDTALLLLCDQQVSAGRSVGDPMGCSEEQKEPDRMGSGSLSNRGTT